MRGRRWSHHQHGRTAPPSPEDSELDPCAPGRGAGRRPRDATGWDRDPGASTRRGARRPCASCAPARRGRRPPRSTLPPKGKARSHRLWLRAPCDVRVVAIAGLLWLAGAAQADHRPPPQPPEYQACPALATPAIPGSPVTPAIPGYPGSTTPCPPAPPPRHDEGVPDPRPAWVGRRGANVVRDTRADRRPRRLFPGAGAAVRHAHRLRGRALHFTVPPRRASAIRPANTAAGRAATNGPAVGASDAHGRAADGPRPAEGRAAAPPAQEASAAARRAQSCAPISGRRSSALCRRNVHDPLFGRAARPPGPPGRAVGRQAHGAVPSSNTWLAAAAPARDGCARLQRRRSTHGSPRPQVNSSSSPPTGLRLLTPWNEPNHASHRAARRSSAARYYDAAPACPRCTLQSQPATCSTPHFQMRH